MSNDGRSATVLQSIEGPLPKTALTVDDADVTAVWI